MSEHDDDLLTHKDVLKRVITELLYNTEAAYDGNGWDQPPGLHWLAVRDDMTDDETVGLELSQLDVPQAIWAAAKRPALVVEYVTEMVADVRAQAEYAVRPLLGVVFVSEAWVLSLHAADTAQLDQAFEAAHRHEVDKHPDRYEVRTVVAVDRLGQRYLLSHERDGAITEHFDDDVQGDVADALSNLILVSL